MKRFGYAADPICLIACALYAANRWWLSQHVGGPFLHGYFNDLLLIPAALPLALWLQRRLGCRSHDQAPTWSEIALHLVVWSVTAEALIPQLLTHSVADWKDVAAYTFGAAVAGCWWREIPIT
jgi:hypothetical protein